ncbi:MAG: hypothetical protein ACYDA8_10000, partial [Deferrisomatales bacterium]
MSPWSRLERRREVRLRRFGTALGVGLAVVFHGVLFWGPEVEYRPLLEQATVRRVLVARPYTPPPPPPPAVAPAAPRPTPEAAAPTAPPAPASGGSAPTAPPAAATPSPATARPPAPEAPPKAAAR